MSVSAATDSSSKPVLLLPEGLLLGLRAVRVLGPAPPSACISTRIPPHGTSIEHLVATPQLSSNEKRMIVLITADVH